MLPLLHDGSNNSTVCLPLQAANGLLWDHDKPLLPVGPPCLPFKARRALEMACHNRGRYEANSAREGYVDNMTIVDTKTRDNSDMASPLPHLELEPSLIHPVLILISNHELLLLYPSPLNGQGRLNLVVVVSIVLVSLLELVRTALPERETRVHWDHEGPLAVAPVILVRAQNTHPRVDLACIRRRPVAVH